MKIIFSENRFNKKFDVLSELGSGGFGTVFKVKQKDNDMFTAVKKIKLKGQFCLKILNNG